MSHFDQSIPLKSGVSGLALGLTAFSAVWAGTLPGNGHFVAGAGTITRAGSRMTIEQASRTGIVDWRTFSVGVRNTVAFENSGGATLNRITGGNLSRIAGSLRATGSVYLVNRAGVAITSSGRVDTQGDFAVSSRDADEDTFASDRRLRLTGGGKGNVVDAGRITARNVSLIAAGTVRTPGSIAATRNVETSGSHLRLAGGTITAQTWLIDPKNLKVTASAAATIQTSLNHGTNMILKTTASGTSGPGSASSGPGDITVAAPITWFGTARLTLDAYHAVVIDAKMEIKQKGALVIKTSDGGPKGGLSFASGGNVTFDNLHAALTINGDPYTLVKNITTLASDIAADSGGDYALAADYDAAADGTYHTTPIPTLFSGSFEGLGHRISNLTINDTTSDDVGLFAVASSGTAIRNLTLANARVTAMKDNVRAGAMCGSCDAIFAGDHVAGAVVANSGGAVGGMVGFDYSGNISNSTASDSVTVIGANGSNTGGLVGYFQGAVMNNSQASGAVRAADNSWAGGLAGDNFGMIENSHATGSVTGGLNDGGLAGFNSGTIKTSYATGRVSGEQNVGGLVGTNGDGQTIGQSFATGNVAGVTGYQGGLVGFNEGAVWNGYALGTVNGSDNSKAGGFVGYNDTTGTIANSYSAGYVSVDATSTGGGFLGYNNSSTVGALSDDYFNTSGSGITTGVGGGASGGVTGKTGAQLKAALPAGFNASVWAETPGINRGLPYLKAAPPP